MPKTTMYKNYRAMFAQNQIGFARHVFAVQSVPETFPMKKLTNYRLGPRVLRANATHDAASIAFGKGVHNFLSTD